MLSVKSILTKTAFHLSEDGLHWIILWKELLAFNYLTLLSADLVKRIFEKKENYHYRRRLLCRVPEALGKGRYTLGKGRSVNSLSAKTSLPSVLYRALCRVLIWHSAKKSRRDGERHRDGGFAECQGQALGKGTLFAERRWLRHSAKVAT